MRRKLIVLSLVSAFAIPSVAAYAAPNSVHRRHYRHPAVAAANVRNVRRNDRRTPFGWAAPARYRRTRSAAVVPARDSSFERDRQRSAPAPRGYGYHYGHDRDGWGGRPYYWHGRPYWRVNIRVFPRAGWPVWRRGYWYQGWHYGRWGWWWLAGGAWYYYPAPIYPYPNPYVPGSVVVVTSQPSPPAPPAQAPVQYWYRCSAPQGYYPYVPECPGGWTPVPASPAPSPPSPPAPPAPPPAPPPAQAPVQNWYYCNSAHSYYPHVASCPEGWTPVPVTPPPSVPPSNMQPPAVPPPGNVPPPGR